MPLELRIPARINIFGNPSEGWVGDYAIISVAVNVFAGAHFETADDLVGQRLSGLGSDCKIVYQESFPQNTIPLPYTGSLDLVKGSVFALVNPGQEDAHMQVWHKTAQQAGLNAAKDYHMRIVQHGFEIKEL